jgi:hypothetical protein
METIEGRETLLLADEARLPRTGTLLCPRADAGAVVASGTQLLTLQPPGWPGGALPASPRPAVASDQGAFTFLVASPTTGAVAAAAGAQLYLGSSQAPGFISIPLGCDAAGNDLGPVRGACWNPSSAAPDVLACYLVREVGAARAQPPAAPAAGRRHTPVHAGSCLSGASEGQGPTSPCNQPAPRPLAQAVVVIGRFRDGAWTQLAALRGPSSRGGAAAAAWTSDGTALVVSWQSDLQVISWPAADEAAFAAGPAATTTVLTGLPGPFRALATGASGSIVGTIDQMLLLGSRGGEAAGSSSSSLATPAASGGGGGGGAAGGGTHRRSTADDTSPPATPTHAHARDQGHRDQHSRQRRDVVDLRGVFSNDTAAGRTGSALGSLLNLAAGPSFSADPMLVLQSGLADPASGQLLGGGQQAAASAPPARVCVLWGPGTAASASASPTRRFGAPRLAPPGSTPGPRSTGRVAANHSQRYATVAELALPRPDVLHVSGNLVIVASSTGPAIVQLFASTASSGLTLLHTLSLASPAWPGAPPASLRVRGAVLQAPRGDGGGGGGGQAEAAPQLVALLAKPQATQEIVGFTKGCSSAATVTAALSLSAFRMDHLQALQQELHATAMEVTASPAEVHAAAPAAAPGGATAAAAAAAAVAPPPLLAPEVAAADPILRLISLMEGLQANVTLRMGRMTSVLEDYGERLAVIEQHLGAGTAPADPRAGQHLYGQRLAAIENHLRAGAGAAEPQAGQQPSPAPPTGPQPSMN